MFRLVALFFICCLTAISASVPIVFVHLGRHVPSYYKIAIEQAHTFNPESPIYLIIHARAAQRLIRKKMLPEYTQLIIAQDLTISEKHKRFSQLPFQTVTDSMLKFWRYSLERFFLLEEFMNDYEIEEVVHMEGDTLLYTELDGLVPRFRTCYPGLALPFLFDEESVCCFLYVNNRTSLGDLTQFINDNLIGEGYRSDMTLLALFAKETGIAEHLPSVSPRYLATQPMVSLNGRKTSSPEKYANNAEYLGVLFDPAPIGQYLDGESNMQVNRKPSVINQNAVYNSSHFKLMWEKDAKGRRVPFLHYLEEKWPLANIHVHSKQLMKFSEEAVW